MLRAKSNKDESYMAKFSVSAAQLHDTTATYQSCAKQVL